MMLKVFFVANAMVSEAGLPNGQLRLQAEGESSFDELNGLLERSVIVRRDQSVEMVGHDDEFVKEVFSLASVMQEHVHEEISGGVFLEDGPPSGGDRCDEESSIHTSNVAFAQRKSCAGGHSEIVRF